MENTLHFTNSSLHHSRLSPSCHQPLCFLSIENYFLCLRQSKLSIYFFLTAPPQKKSLLFLTVLSICLFSAQMPACFRHTSPVTVSLQPQDLSFIQFQPHTARDIVPCRNSRPLWDRHTKQQQQSAVKKFGVKWGCNDRDKWRQRIKSPVTR